MRALIVTMLLFVPAYAIAGPPTLPSTPQPRALATSPSTNPELPLPGYVTVPLHDIRDAMIYLGARASSDEIAGVIYGELANGATAAERVTAGPEPRRDYPGEAADVSNQKGRTNR
jgi:hypothetical protein